MCDNRTDWFKVIGWVIVICWGFSAAVALTGCDDGKICKRSVNGECVERGYAPRPAQVSERRSKGTERRGPHLCVGICAGPHINLLTGQLELFSVGSVGLSLF